MAGSRDLRPARLLLASASPRRAALLRALGVEFDVAPPGGVVEWSAADAPHLSPRELTWRNAWAKARAAGDLHRGRIVLTCDTLVALGGDVLGKPRHRREARRMLARLSGRTHHVHTAVALVHPHRPIAGFVETTCVRFRRLSPSRIERYLRLVNVLDKAGAYGIQEHGELLVDAVEGSVSNVMGLPIEELACWLRRHLSGGERNRY